MPYLEVYKCIWLAIYIYTWYWSRLKTTASINITAHLRLICQYHEVIFTPGHSEPTSNRMACFNSILSAYWRPNCPSGVPVVWWTEISWTFRARVANPSRVNDFILFIQWSIQPHLPNGLPGAQYLSYDILRAHIVVRTDIEYTLLTHWDLVIPYGNIDPGKHWFRYLLDGSKPFPGSMLTYHQEFYLASIWEQFRKMCP